MKNITYDVFELQIRSGIETRVIAFSTCKRVDCFKELSQRSMRGTRLRNNTFSWFTREGDIRGKFWIEGTEFLSEYFRLPRITFHDQIVYGIDNHIVEEARFICRIARRHDRGTVLLDGKSISINRDAARTRLKVITHASAFIAEILFYDYH